jgi:hypothetical protein
MKNASHETQKPESSALKVKARFDWRPDERGDGQIITLLCDIQGPSTIYAANRQDQSHALYSFVSPRHISEELIRNVVRHFESQLRRSLGDI